MVIGADGYFGERVAADYDSSDGDEFDPGTIARTADFLAQVATRTGSGRRALEFAIGTGRVALPLARRGLEVHGIELSSAMAARLHAKDGGEAIDVVIGDMATTRVAGSFSLVYLVFNTIMNLTSRDAQVACFRNAAGHLEPGGSFVIEVLVPSPPRGSSGERYRVFDAGATHWGVDEYPEGADQRVISHHFTLADGRWDLASIPFRYVFPSELDLMAQLAGLTLRERWAGWGHEPFSTTSLKHVSIWAKPGG